MEIGSVIREKRTAQGLTQEQVATALGVSAPAVSKWERGESFPEITLLPALARLLGQVGEEQEEALRALCRAAAEELAAQLRTGLEPEACGEAFRVAAAWTGATAWRWYRPASW